MSLANQPVRALNTQKTSAIYYQGVLTLAAGGAGSTASVVIPYLTTAGYSTFIQPAIATTLTGVLASSITIDVPGLGKGNILVVGTNNAADVGKLLSVLITTVAN